MVVIERREDYILRENYLDEQFLYNHSFLRYASDEWQEHALAASQALITGYEFRMVDKLPTFRDTWLLGAAIEGQEVVVQRLLHNGAELNLKDDNGQTPLSWAAEYGHEAVVKLLLSRDVAADPQSKHGRTPISYAAEKGHEAVVKLLLSRDDVAADSQDTYDRTPLSYAARRGHGSVGKLRKQKMKDASNTSGN